MSWCFRPYNSTSEYEHHDVEFKIPNGYECDTVMSVVINKFYGVAHWYFADEERTKIRVIGNFNLKKLVKKLTRATGEKLYYEDMEYEEKDDESE
ncbi:unnamed protein product [Thlaspi arvense]|uniref:Uncharacterized protein n=1 Tax=Thlaspi arvense TaxID=13288 RepID=A0AAU9T8R7_THLAR|nr:unnamed protein product [Thlaspi arvense]